MKINKAITWSLSLAALFFASCGETTPMDENLYPESVYIVGAADQIIDRDLNIGYLQDTIHVSVAVSGSLPTGQNVTVTLEEFPSAIQRYNDRQLGSDDVHYRNLRSDIYSFPNQNATVKKGEVYGTYPIHVNPESLHVDSLYMLSMKLKSISAYEMAKEDTVVLIRLNLMNQYSGLYYMDGIIKEISNPDDSVVYKSSRTLQAVVDGNTVRMYHQKNEWSKGATDYRPGFCFNISVNSDNSLSLAPWQNFELLDGGGTYYKELKVYDLWYTFVEDGITKKVRGFLYKERKNDEEQRIINDWMEENRRYD